MSSSGFKDGAEMAPQAQTAHRLRQRYSEDAEQPHGDATAEHRTADASQEARPALSRMAILEAIEGGACPQCGELCGGATLCDCNAGWRPRTRDEIVDAILALGHSA